VQTRLPASSSVQTALDRSVQLYKMLTWTGLLLAATLYIIGAFGPLGPFSPSAGPWLMLDISTLTLVHDTDLTRPIPVFVRDHARAFPNAGYRA
jgi:hypothetical protein